MPRSVTALLLAAVAALAVALAGPAAASADSDQTMSFEAPRELLDPAQRDLTLDRIKALGVTRIRALVYWNRVAPEPGSPSKPSGFDAANSNDYPVENWRAYDDLIAAADARGIKVLLTITGPIPKWATKSKHATLTDPSPTEFGRFAQAVGERYGSQVHLWSIWNEPNQPQFLLPQFKHGKPYSPRLYRRLYQHAVRGLRATSDNRHDSVLMGETSPRGSGKVIVAPLAFLRGAMCLNSRYHKRRGCARLDTQGYAHHAYTTKAGPTFKPRERDDVTIGVLSRLNSALAKAGRAGAVRKGLPIYLTEFGIQSKPDPFVGVSLQRQAEYQAISERIAYDNARVHWFSQYLMDDDKPREGPKTQRYSGFESGLRFADDKPKPSYDAFPIPLAAQRRGSRVRLWGIVRPASGRTRVTIEYRNRGSSTWRRLKGDSTNARGAWATYANYRKGRQYRVRWSGGGQTLVGPGIRVYR